MKKLLLLLLLSTNVLAQGDPAPYVKGQKSTGLGNQASTIFVPSNQSTKINAYQALLETGNPNMLVNPEFEGSVSSGWTCTTGTCTKTTTSGEFSSGLAAMKIVPAANVLNVSQSVNTPAGIQSQGFAKILYRVPSTCSTSFVIRTLINGSTHSEVPTNRLIFDDKFHEIEIPLVFSTTSAGIQVFASGTCTGNIFIDGAVVAQGLGTQNLMLDNTYSATIQTTSGTVSNLSKSAWLSCTAVNPTACTFATGIFTVVPNCTVTPIISGNVFSRVNSLTSTGITIQSVNAAGTDVANVSFSVICQKSGNDYLKSSANVYSQASVNTDWASYTPTFGAGFGTVSPATNQCKYKRDGGNLVGSCSFTMGTPANAIYSFSLPSGLSLDTTKIIAANTTSNPGQTVGDWVQSVSFGKVVTATGTSVTNLYLGSSAATVQTPSSTLTSFNSALTTINFSVPISGWSNSNVIVGSFAGVPAVPGYQGKVDTFSVDFGGVSTASECSTATCFKSVIGSGGVSSVTWTTPSNYSMNTFKTYSNLSCSLNATNISLGVGGFALSALTCQSCNALPFITRRSDTNVPTAMLGKLICIGTY